jgi:uncharacterized membrane protein
MSLFKSVFDLVEDVITLPTDILGLTNHHDKKKALEIAKVKFINGEITAVQYEQVKKLIND